MVASLSGPLVEKQELAPEESRNSQKTFRSQRNDIAWKWNYKLKNIDNMNTTGGSIYNLSCLTFNSGSCWRNLYFNFG